MRTDIRLATQNDIERLIDICQRAFPNSLRWKTLRRFSRKWWLCRIFNPAMDIYILSVDGKVASFYLLIQDLEKYQNEKMNEDNNYEINLWSRIIAVILHPGLLGSTIIRIFRNLFYEFKTDEIINERINEMKIPISKMAWGELQAVAPEFQGIGLSKIMQDFILSRCKELGKIAIAANLESENRKVIALHEKYGYTKVKYTNDGIRIIKIL